MRRGELDDAIAAANPVGPEHTAALGMPADGAALLDAVAGEPPAAGSSPAGSRLPVLAPLVALLLALAVVAGAFTTPGGAVTGWVGERLGLGEPGGPPSLRQLNESWSDAMGTEGQRQYVLVVGPVTGQERSRYEFITYDPVTRPDRPTWPDGPCFKLDLTQRRSMGSQGCGVLPEGGQFAFLGVGGSHDHAEVAEDGAIRFSNELHYLSGRVGPEVATVEATVDGREIPVQVRPVPEDLRRRFDLGGPFSFFIGFFSGVPRGGTVAVTARGPGGERLGHAETEMIDQAMVKRATCRSMLEDARRLPRPGREECRQVLGRGAR